MPVRGLVISGPARQFNDLVDISLAPFGRDLEREPVNERRPGNAGHFRRTGWAA